MPAGRVLLKAFAVSSEGSEAFGTPLQAEFLRHCQMEFRSSALVADEQTRSFVLGNGS